MKFVKIFTTCLLAMVLCAIIEADSIIYNCENIGLVVVKDIIQHLEDDYCLNYPSKYISYALDNIQKINLNISFCSNEISIDRIYISQKQTKLDKSIYTQNVPSTKEYNIENVDIYTKSSINLKNKNNSIRDIKFHFIKNENIEAESENIEAESVDYAKDNQEELQQNRESESGFVQDGAVVKEHKKVKVVLIGDSLMEDLGETILKNKKYKDKSIQYILSARHSTGICNGNYYNWLENTKKIIQQNQPNIVVIFIGGNDFIPILYGHKRILFNTEDWKSEYMHLCSDLTSIIKEGHAIPIWIGLPVMGEPIKEKYGPMVMTLQKQACENTHITYIDTFNILADENGKFQMYMKSKDNQMIRIRKDDKYHISTKGNIILLDNLILPAIYDNINKIQ